MSLGTITGARPPLRRLITAVTVLLVALGATPSVQVTAQVSERARIERDAGTEAMAARLAAISRTADEGFNNFLNGRRAQRLLTSPEPKEHGERLRYLYSLAAELLLDGDSVGAVRAMQVVMQLLAQDSSGFSRQDVEQAQAQLAVAYLRLGEQENCITAHNVDRCLLPIRDAGVHTVERGSRAAIEALTPLLADHPGDLGFRWLLNLAYMTLGEHPEKVPEQFLIPPVAFASDYDIGRFRDIAPDLGLDTFGLSGGAAMEDFNGDGLLDIMASSSGIDDQIRVFFSRGDGSFEERTRSAGLEEIIGGLNLAHADYDNDGHPDVFVTRGAWLQREGHHPNSLLRSNGDGTFSDVTEKAGLLSFHPTQVAVWGDYDNDGWIDLFVGNESLEHNEHPAELFHNNGDGTFSDVATDVGLSMRAYIKGAAWGDYDNDGLIDLYVSNMSGPNWLFRNRGSTEEGGWRFEEVGEHAGVREPHSSFPTWFFDYDNDGWLDLFVAGYRGSIDDVAADYLGLDFDAELPRLYRNNGDGTFSNRARAAGLDTVLMPMGCNYGDLDHDGYPDFYLGTGDTEMRSLMPNRMFRNDRGRGFQDVTTSGGFGHLQKGHGVAFGDLDNDGDQDIYTVMGGAHSGDGFNNALFENPGHGNRWLTLFLRGTTANRAAIGARLRVSVDTATGAQDIYSTVSSGGSFGASSLRQEIGLGRATAIRSIEVGWPDGSDAESFGPLELDSAYEIVQGSGTVAKIELASFQLGAAGHPGSAQTREHPPQHQKDPEK